MRVLAAQRMPCKSDFEASVNTRINVKQFKNSVARGTRCVRNDIPNSIVTLAASPVNRSDILLILLLCPERKRKRNRESEKMNLHDGSP